MQKRAKLEQQVDEVGFERIGCVAQWLARLLAVHEVACSKSFVQLRYEMTTRETESTD